MLDYTGPNQTWLDALTRAECADIRVKQLDTGSEDEQCWRSTSSQGTPAGDPFIYAQAVLAGPYGIEVECTCEAHGPCLHLAKVLNEMGHLVVEDEPSPLPEPTPLRQPTAKLSVAEINNLLFGEF